jgi:hypothetical protein
MAARASAVEAPHRPARRLTERSLAPSSAAKRAGRMPAPSHHVAKERRPRWGSLQAVSVRTSLPSALLPRRARGAVRAGLLQGGGCRLGVDSCIPPRALRSPLPPLLLALALHGCADPDGGAAPADVELAGAPLAAAPTVERTYLLVLDEGSFGIAPTPPMRGQDGRAPAAWLQSYRRQVARDPPRGQRVRPSAGVASSILMARFRYPVIRSR